jgi:transitional endoplasmic reticulum ATPase
MSLNKTILSKSEKIDDKYTVQFFVKRGSHAETYRVKDSEGVTRFLKLFDLSKLHRTQFDAEGNIKEVEFLKTLQHPNLVQYQDSNEWIFENRRFAYLVLDFISGETLEDRLIREQAFPAYEVRNLVSGVLNGLKHLHTSEKPLVHNDINHQNIMVDLGGFKPIPKIIDFGYARYFHNSTKVFYRADLNPYYLAPECFNSIFSPQSDLFSVGALIYHLLAGIPPWFVDLSEFQKDRIDQEEAILAARQKPLKLPALATSAAPDPEREKLFAIALKAMQHNTDLRFSTAEEMLQAVHSDSYEFHNDSNSHSSPSPSERVIEKKKGKGFDAIAGMDELKETLFNDVIQALAEKELYAEYGLSIPNGMLLYGPPGCGKSYFAQRLAEEVGYNYVEVKPSELASIYVHGTQEKIGKLFADARRNAPTILNFEEFDAFVPRRDGHRGRNQSGEVNEFLAQLNNCGENGVFVIASTNQPTLIDPAVLRSGRIDKVFYVPPPDFKARKEMFKLLLAKRPLDFGIDFDRLAEMTKNYVSSDIQHLVNEAARKALKARSKITENILVEVISSSRPSVKIQEVKRYEQIKAQFEGSTQEDERPSIGFKRNN